MMKLLSKFKSWLLSNLGVTITPAPPAVGLCDCPLSVKAEHVGYVEHAYLQSGHHTAFALMRCRGCKRITGFPRENLVNALENGTPQTKALLMEIMGAPVPLEIAYSAVLGGVGACSPDIYRAAMDEIAKLMRRENDESFRSEVRAHEETLPCPID